DRIERSGKLRNSLRRLNCLGDACGKLAAVGLLFQELDAVLAFRRGELVEIDKHGRAVVLAGPDREGMPLGSLGFEAHHRFVNRTGSNSLPPRACTKWLE